MSLDLAHPDTTPGINVRSWSGDGEPLVVCLGQYEIAMSDLLAATLYALTNTDLRPDDPRLLFVQRVRELEQFGGFDRGRRRLADPYGNNHLGGLR